MIGIQSLEPIKVCDDFVPRRRAVVVLEVEAIQDSLATRSREVTAKELGESLLIQLSEATKDEEGTEI